MRTTMTGATSPSSPPTSTSIRVTQVALRPTPASEEAGKPALTPELLAASGARYSRNNEGLQSILDKIDPNNLDKSVDSIFRMIDYGHQSIADMAPVAMFMDNMSIWLAYYVWTLCPVAGGQESSTRYIEMNPEGLPHPQTLGIPPDLHAEWQEDMGAAFTAYNQYYDAWIELSKTHPAAARLPEDLLADKSDKAQRKINRLKRNFGFDRARVFLPAAVKTNVMLIMSARAWVSLCEHLLSYPATEAQALGVAIRSELEPAVPRMLKHAVAKQSTRAGIDGELANWAQAAAQTCSPLQPGAHSTQATGPALEVLLPPGVDEKHLAQALEHHDNRYAYFGPAVCRTSVRFSWQAMSFGEIRDLNRHRTGTKYCPLIPQGFYYSAEQIPEDAQALKQLADELAEVGRRLTAKARTMLAENKPYYIYWTLLGTQFPFEHTTTADKFLYEAELRTGMGAHFRYAEHLKEILRLWYTRFPSTEPLILEGSAEPE